MTQRILRMYLWWSLCTFHLLASQLRVTVSDSRLLLLCLCDDFRALINSLVCWYSDTAFSVVIHKVCGSVSLSVSLCFYLSLSVSLCFSLSVSLSLPVCLSLSLPVCLCLSVSVSVSLSLPPLSLSLSLNACARVCLRVKEERKKKTLAICRTNEKGERWWVGREKQTHRHFYSGGFVWRWFNYDGPRDIDSLQWWRLEKKRKKKKRKKVLINHLQETGVTLTGPHHKNNAIQSLNWWSLI